MIFSDINDIFIGIDGGASKTRGVIFSGDGKTIAQSTILRGSNLTIYKSKAVERICLIIHDLVNKSKIDLGSVRCMGLGIAGASDEDMRDLLFKELDKLKISEKTLLANDAEAAYEVCCPNNTGVLVTVGTGVICIGKNQSGKLLRVAGKGHYSGDIGSGFWIGYQSILKLSMDEGARLDYPEDCMELLSLICNKLNINNLDDDFKGVMDSSECVRDVASLSKSIIKLAKTNEIALTIIQESTTAIADYIIDLVNQLEYNTKNIILSTNGSIIKNEYFRQSLNDALQFNLRNITWISSKISPAYGAAILAAKYKNINIKLSDIADKEGTLEVRS